MMWWRCCGRGRRLVNVLLHDVGGKLMRKEETTVRQSTLCLTDEQLRASLQFFWELPAGLLSFSHPKLNVRIRNIGRVT